MPEVLNKYKLNGRTGIYVGRGTPYGNPFVLGRDGDRDKVVERFDAYIGSRPKLQELVKSNLKGHNLICFCAPLRCHADILLRIANG